MYRYSWRYVGEDEMGNGASRSAGPAGSIAPAD
jgi:hypothetical protein